MIHHDAIADRNSKEAKEETDIGNEQQGLDHVILHL